MDDRKTTSCALAGNDREKNLPCKQVTGGVDTSTSNGRCPFVISNVEALNLAKAVEMHGIEMPAFLLAGFQLTLFRYSRQKELVLSAPAQPFLELARSLPCQDHVTIDRGRVRTDLTLVDFPKSKGSPFLSECRIRFVFDAEPVSLIDLIEDFDEKDSDLSLFLRKDFTTDSSICLRGEIHYNTDLWDQREAERFLKHLLNVLAEASHDAQLPISSIAILSADERLELTHSFNETSVEYPTDLCIHELFELQVERTPDAVALIFENQQLTYTELNARANRVAYYLQDQGVESRTPVGLCVERSLDLVVSILGILKAGGTYVPLDADYPADRTAHMLECAQVKTVLTTHSQPGSVFGSCHRLYFEEAVEESCRKSDRELPIPLPHQSTAYIIFTSGSTGIPKGVPISHSSAVNLLCWAKSNLFSCGEQALIGVAPATFDISVAEFLAPLMCGRTSILVGKQTARDTSLLIEAISRQDNCVVQATPSTWAALLEYGWNGSGCRTAVTTGEALPGAVRSKLMELDLRVLDLYGPTETTIWSTCHTVRKEDSFNCIGQPISNTQVFVLDSYGDLVPIGVPGELFIGGDGLASGYLNRPDLTSERFVVNPFSEDPASRLYRTGDLCRWRAEGRLEYLGRLDHQVKLRGYRIELGEIESVLSQ